MTIQIALRSFPSFLAWLLIGFIGAVSIGILAISRGENVNALWMVVESVCVFAIAYRFDSAWLMTSVLTPDELRATPARLHGDAKDYVPAIMVILLAVLALVVVKALAESPWGLFTILASLPIAMAMGVRLRLVAEKEIRPLREEPQVALPAA